MRNSSSDFPINNKRGFIYADAFGRFQFLSTCFIYCAPALSISVFGGPRRGMAHAGFAHVTEVADESAPLTAEEEDVLGKVRALNHHTVPNINDVVAMVLSK